MAEQRGRIFPLSLDTGDWEFSNVALFFPAELCRVDINRDKKISAKEMQRWIMEKTEEHFQEAVEENKMHFRAVDPDGDGKRKGGAAKGDSLGLSRMAAMREKNLPL